MSTIQDDNQSRRDIDVSVVVTAGTSQNLIDVGCASHDPQLYHSDYLWPDGIAINRINNNNNNDDVDDDDDDDDDDIMERYVHQFHRDGFIVFPDAVSTLFQSTNHNTTTATATTQTLIEELDVAIDELIDGTNESFAIAVKDVISSSELSKSIPDFTNGDKIPYIQYEAGTNLSSTTASSPMLFTPTTAPKVRKIMGFVGYHPTIDTLVHHPKLVNIVSRLLLHSKNYRNKSERCDEIELFQDMALLKPPNGGREKPWHQDKAYFNIHISEPVVGCWMAIDPATIDNGCLRFEMKTNHRSTTTTTTDDFVEHSPQFLPEMHFMVRDYQICDTVDRRGKVIAIPLPPGGLILFDGMIPHGTPTNTMTSSRRRALQFHWTRKDPKRCTTQERCNTFGGVPNGLSC